MSEENRDLDEEKRELLKKNQEYLKTETGEAPPDETKIENPTAFPGINPGDIDPNTPITLSQLTSILTDVQNQMLQMFKKLDDTRIKSENAMAVSFQSALNQSIQNVDSKHTEKGNDNADYLKSFFEILKENLKSEVPPTSNLETMMKKKFEKELETSFDITTLINEKIKQSLTGGVAKAITKDVLEVHSF